MAIPIAIAIPVNADAVRGLLFANNMTEAANRITVFTPAFTVWRAIDFRDSTDSSYKLLIVFEPKCLAFARNRIEH